MVTRVTTPDSWSFITEELGSIRDLKGFAPHRAHHAPYRKDAKAIAFVRKVGELEFAAASTSLFQRLRQGYGLTRKQIKVDHEDGLVRLETAELWAEIQLTVFAGNPEQYAIQTCLRPRNLDVAAGPCFFTLTGYHVVRAEYTPVNPFIIEGIIDTLEAHFPAELIHYPVDFSFVRLHNEPMGLYFQPEQLRIQAGDNSQPGSPQAVSLFLTAIRSTEGIWKPKP